MPGPSFHGMDESEMEKYLVRNVELGHNTDIKGKIWVPDEVHGYVMAEQVRTDDKQVTVKLTNGDMMRFKKEETGQVNPGKFDKWEDMASLTHLNETYSGLFCVAINPYKRLPIYGPRTVGYYRGKRRSEVPPHVFAIADNAYHDMLQERNNQSILITGESGAGKTENTKKVISYFANVGANTDSSPKQRSGGSLEDQIVQTNPVLESFGNAKTVRNDNSSRFGKFIRIHFGPNGKLAGADIEHYLLEKARVTSQMEGKERCYHMFYQILTKGVPGLTKKLQLTGKPEDYNFIKHGQYVVNSIDDEEEAILTDKAFDILGFTQDEKDALYKLCAGILHLGNMKFKTKPREEQVEGDPKDEAGQKVANLFKISVDELIKAFVKPRVKVGSETVVKGQNLDQVGFAQSAMGKAIFDRMFKWLIDRVNMTLETGMTRSSFIGVLDIAGFEIFELNTFEQLCINFTNEKLQQFFNHHMFVREQEEYKREGIEWAFIDFGMDLQDTINLIEKPLGVLSILEEECIVPKATDMTFLKKLEDNHLGKSKSFGRPKLNKNAKFPVHFELHHYAGTVGYNIISWLEKNKDPMNDTVAEVFSRSGLALLALLFKIDESEDSNKKGKKKKGTQQQTISANHKDQLNKLMTTLHSTSPHFIRCIVPNEKKAPGVIDAELVLHQLRCNGVLEGIRICRKGFPNRLNYGDFHPRYIILAPNAGDDDSDSKETSINIVKELGLDKSEYRFAGVLGLLEEKREDRLNILVSSFQALLKRNAMKKRFKKMLDQRIGLMVIQRNVRKYLQLRTWGWFRLYTKVKPLLSVARAEDEMKIKEGEIKEMQESLNKLETVVKNHEQQSNKLKHEKNVLQIQLDKELETLTLEQEKSTKQAALIREKDNLIRDFEERLEDEENANNDLVNTKRKLENEISELKNDMSSMDSRTHKLTEENKNKEHAINALKDERLQQEQALSKLQHTKRDLESQLHKTLEDLQSEEEKVNNLNKIKSKIEMQLEETEDSLEREIKGRSDLEKVRRKLESDLKMAQEAIDELDKRKHEVEDQLRKRDFEIQNLISRNEDLENMINQQRKRIKEAELRIEDLEEENEAERLARGKVEKQKNDLARELEDLSDKLDEQGGLTAAQIELNKRRESDLIKLRHELEEITLSNEQSLNLLRKKHQEQLAEVQTQLDIVTKVKAKLEKEKQQYKMEAEDSQSNFEVLQKNKQNADRLIHNMENQISEMKAELEEQQRTVQEANSSKNKLMNEIKELTKQIEDYDSNIATSDRQKRSLLNQLEEARKLLEDESKARSTLQSQYNNLSREADQLRENLEDEEVNRADMQRQLVKAGNELAALKSKFEIEATAKIQELEENRKKMLIRLQDTEEQLENALARNQSLDKARSRMQGELEDAVIECEKIQSAYSSLEKAQKKFDQEITGWKQKVEELQVALDASQKDNRNVSSELMRMKNTCDDMNDQMDSLRRENKNLQVEISDLTEQLGEGGRGIHEIEKAKRRVEIERDELQATLNETEGALENEEAKVMRLQLEISQLKSDCERKIHDKEEEFEASRRSLQKSFDQLQSTLESEMRLKHDSLKQRKKLETDLNEYEVALDVANRNNADGQKIVKKLQGQIKDLQTQLEEEQRLVDEMREQVNSAERRTVNVTSELNDLRVAYEQSENNRRRTEVDLSVISERISDFQAQVNALTAAKRKAEQEIQQLHSNSDDMIHEVKSAEERYRKAQNDSARLAEELRSEQEHSSSMERKNRLLEQQLKESAARLEEAEMGGSRYSKRNIERLESRVRDLENEKQLEHQRQTESFKSIRKLERRLKESEFALEEERKEREKYIEEIDRLGKKNLIFKRQIDELEDANSSALMRLKKLQHDVEDADERAELAENTIIKLRAKHRSQGSTSATRKGFGSSTVVTKISRSTVDGETRKSRRDEEF